MGCVPPKAIAVAAIAFLIVPWLSTPAASAAPLSVTPELVFSVGEIPDSIALGESVDLEFQIGLRSGTGGHGGISVSFPDLTARGGNSSSYDSVQGTVTTISYTNGSSHVAYFDEGDQIFKGNDANRSSAEYLLVESDDDDWPSRSGSDYVWRTLKLRVTPKEPGAFLIYSRFWLCGSGYEDCDRRPRPEHSDQEDQQRWSVYEDTVEVSGPTSGPFARNSAEDFDTLDAADNESPKCIWSDETTMWVADWSDEKIYAYSMSNKARVSSKDFDTLDAADNESPEGIWSDGTTMWVADSSDAKIYAYNISNKARVSSKDFDTLDAASNGSPTGIWSDRETVWVADSSDDKIYAYNAPEMAPAPTQNQNRSPSVFRVSPSSALVSLYTGDRQTFTARATDPDNNLKSYSWFVGGTEEDSGVWRLFLPTGSVDKSFSHRFSTAGTYSVKATFTDTEGESDSAEWTVTVRDPNRAPSVVRGSPSTESVSLETGDRQAFTANASDPDNHLRGYEWFVGDVFGDAFVWQTPPTGFASGSFSHTFSTEGTFIVEASFTDTEGLSGSVTWTVTVTTSNRAPSVTPVSPPSPVSLYTGDRQTFEASATDPDDNLKSYEWFVKDRSEESSPIWFGVLPTGSATDDFSHTFGTAGPYTVKATFTDKGGLSDSVSWTVVVIDPSRPSVDRVSPTQESLSLETGDSQSFTVRATDADNDLTKWQWVADWHGVALPHLDPGHTEPEASFALTGDIPKTFSYTFDTAGTWTVTVTFTDSRGESASITWEVTVTDPFPETVTVTINSNPIGLTVMVDGTDRTTPYTADWTSGSSHTLNVPSPQTVSQSAYVFSSWSDGLARSHSVSPTTDTTYTANFTLTTAGGDGRAEITSCGSDPASPTVKDERAPVATVTNHSYSGLLSALWPTEFYVEFTISDTARGLELPGTKSTTKTQIQVGNSHTFQGPAASWPEDDKEQRQQDGSHQLPLFPLKWFPGEITVECELKADDNLGGMIRSIRSQAR